VKIKIFHLLLNESLEKERFYNFSKLILFKQEQEQKICPKISQAKQRFRLQRKNHMNGATH